MLLVNGDYQTDKTVAEAVIAMMAESGIKVTLNTLERQRPATPSSSPAASTGWCGATIPS